MNQFGKTMRIKCMLVVLVTSIFIPTLDSLAQCNPPGYKKGKIWGDSRKAIWMNISIQLKDFAPERLLCLADDLKRRYNDRTDIMINIFSTPWAARRYSITEMAEPGPGQPKAEKQMHGQYIYNENTHEHCIYIHPFGMRPVAAKSQFTVTKFDIPVSSKPQCKMQISGRCLLALDEICYPDEAKHQKIHGTVTLAGNIGLQGKVTGIRISKTNIEPDEAKSILEREALKNLKSWHFENANQENQFQITYYYAINPPSGFRDNLEEVRPELPNSIFITLNPKAPSK
jgi:TonB family protein